MPARVETYRQAVQNPVDGLQVQPTPDVISSRGRNILTGPKARLVEGMLFAAAILEACSNGGGVVPATATPDIKSFTPGPTTSALPIESATPSPTPIASQSPEASPTPALVGIKTLLEAKPPIDPKTKKPEVITYSKMKADVLKAFGEDAAENASHPYVKSLLDEVLKGNPAITLSNALKASALQALAYQTYSVYDAVRLPDFLTATQDEISYFKHNFPEDFATFEKALEASFR